MTNMLVGQLNAQLSTNHFVEKKESNNVTGKFQEKNNSVFDKSEDNKTKKGNPKKEVITGKKSGEAAKDIVQAGKEAAKNAKSKVPEKKKNSFFDRIKKQYGGKFGKKELTDLFGKVKRHKGNFYEKNVINPYRPDIQTNRQDGVITGEKDVIA